MNGLKLNGVKSERQARYRCDQTFHASLRGAIAYFLALALIVMSLPQPATAAWQNLNGTLPGFGLSTTEKVGIIVGGSAAAAVVVLLIVHHKRANSANLSAPVSRFKTFKNESPLRPEENLSATNPLVPGTLKTAAVEGDPMVVAPAPGSDLAPLRAQNQ